jgi:hypothetical protein
VHFPHYIPASNGISIACKYDMPMSFRYACLKTEINFTLFFVIYFISKIYIFKISITHVQNSTFYVLKIT